MASTSFNVAAFVALLLLSLSDASEKHVIVATGVGRRTYKTSIAVIRLGIRKTGPTAASVQAQVASASKAVIEYLRHTKVDKLQTTSVSLYATYDYRAPVRRVTGYTASTTLSFEVPIAQAGARLDGAVRAGATTVSSVSFRAAKSVSDMARRFAIRDAVIRARDEASVAVYSLGRAMGHAIHIKITDTFFAQPVAVPSLQRAFSAANGRPGAPPPTTPIVASEQIVRAYVTVTFSTY